MRWKDCCCHPAIWIRSNGRSRATSDTFQSIQLEFSIERILIEGRQHRCLCPLARPVETDPRRGGHAPAWSWASCLVGTQSILLREAQGDLPFGMGSRVNLSEDRA